MDFDFTPDNKAKESKQVELNDYYASVAKAERLEIYKTFSAFCRISPPLDPPQVAHMMLLHDSGREGGLTRKPGNILLNWRNLYRESGDLVLSVAGAGLSKWLIPFAALSVWNKVYTHSTIDITKEQAVIIFSLWRDCDSKHIADIEKGFNAANSLFIGYGWPKISKSHYTQILKELAKLKCIKLIDVKSVWLCEWVSRNY